MERIQQYRNLGFTESQAEAAVGSNMANEAKRRLLTATPEEEREQALKAGLLKTLDGIETFLQLHYEAGLGSESQMTKVSGTNPTLASYMRPKCSVRGATAAARPEFCRFQPMHSSGDKNDCLVHSFLTATCPSFRRLPADKKDAFADWFRRNVMPTLEPFSKRRDALARVRSQEFLEDTDIGYLAQAYEMHYIVFEGARQGFPSRAFTSDFTARDDVYMIGNRHSVHFEAVRTPAGSYTIKGSEAAAIRNCVEGDAILEGVENMSDKAALVREVRAIPGLSFTVADLRGSVKEIKDVLQKKLEEACSGAAVAAVAAPFNWGLPKSWGGRRSGSGSGSRKLRKVQRLSRNANSRRSRRNTQRR